MMVDMDLVKAGLEERVSVAGSQADVLSQHHHGEALVLEDGETSQVSPRMTQGSYANNSWEDQVEITGLGRIGSPDRLGRLMNYMEDIGTDATHLQLTAPVFGEATIRGNEIRVSHGRPLGPLVLSR